MTAIVGLYSPYPRSGKSTFARALMDDVSGAELVKFADPMREVVVPLVAPFFTGGEAEVLDWLEDDRKDVKPILHLGVTLRHCLQTLGTWGRNLNPDLWASIAEHRIALACAHAAPLIVVDDIRYENEYDMLRSHGATLIAIMRSNSPPTHPHQSNNRLEAWKFDHLITNDGDMNDLRLKALAVEWDLGVT